jgi:hypothetical protein
MRQTKLSKADRCRNLRYKKPALMNLGFFAITEKLDEIQEVCSDIHWAFDDDETLINACDGNDEEAWEFKMAFTEIEGEAYQLYECLRERFYYGDDPAREFDDCSVALIGKRYNAVGYDDYEEDYYSLTTYETHLATTEAGKRIMRKTKVEMLSTIGQVLGIILSFQNLEMKYEYLKATIDIFRDANMSILQVIKEIEQLYSDIFCDDYRKCRNAEKEFDALVKELPDKYWVE